MILRPVAKAAELLNFATASIALEYPFDLNAIEEPIHLIGYSMGGRIALDYAIKNPQKIKTLILISAHLGLPVEKRKQRWLKDCALMKQIQNTPIDSFITHWYDQQLFHSLRSKRDVLTMRQTHTPEILIHMLQYHSLGKQDDYSCYLPKNTHLIVGELDHAYRAHYKNHPHTIIPNAGHAIHLEEPQALAHQISRILTCS